MHSFQLEIWENYKWRLLAATDSREHAEQIMHDLEKRRCIWPDDITRIEKFTHSA